MVELHADDFVPAAGLPPNGYGVLARLSAEESEQEEQKLQAAIFEKMKNLFRKTRPPMDASENSDHSS